MAPPGRLFVIATPIGNLSDLSSRGAESLRQASLVAAEDTRRTRKLLSHLALSKPLLRCDEAAEERATQHVLETLRRGEDVALVGDAGTPAVADPGARLVDAAFRAGFPVIPIPGPSAITTALSAAGFRATPFRFYGFPPKKSGARKKLLEEMLQSGETCVFFEAPYRLPRTLRELSELAPDRTVLVGRELTKQHEELARGSLKEIADRFSQQNVRGECTIVLAPLKKSDLRRQKRVRSTVEEE